MVLAVNMLYSNLLVLHAGAAESQVYCGREAHTHTADACYAVSQTLICENTEEGHAHDDACYEDETVLICAYPEVSHTHAEACWLAESTLNCTYHEHTEACFTTEEATVCGVTAENHVHTEDCEESEAKLICGITDQVHTHDDACYTDSEVLSCQEHAHTQACRKAESVLTCLDTTAEHEHDDACYTASETLICEYPDSTHEHTDVCWRSEPSLSCDLHEHADTCYATTWSCGVTVENHVHTEACSESQAVLNCEITQQIHEHDDSCYTYDETLICQEHVHTQECSEAKLVLTCELEEHVHDLSCCANPEADLESADTWEADLPESLSGSWREDLLAVVNSQLGYQESSENYLVESDGETLAGYNRYGAWYGGFTQDENQPYAPWNVTFLFFSLYYAQIADLPLEETCADWIDALDYYGLYVAADAYIPTAGDLVFADTDGDGKADRAGVAAKMEEQMLTVIEGDADGKVAEVIYDLSVSSDEETEWVIGYADMGKAQADAQPENSNVSLLPTWTAGSSVLYLDASAISDWRYDTRFWYKTTSKDTNGGDVWTGMNMTNNGGGKYSITLPADMNVDNSEFRFGRYAANGNLNGETANQTLNGSYDEYVVKSVQEGTATDANGNTTTTWSFTGEWGTHSTDSDDTGTSTEAYTKLILDTSPIADNGTQSGWESAGDDGGPKIWFYYNISGDISNENHNNYPRIAMTKVAGYDHRYEVSIPTDLDRTLPIMFWRRSTNNDHHWNYTPKTTLQANTNEYVLDTWDTGHWKVDITEVDTLPEIEAGKRRVFFDATLSKMIYPEEGNGSKTIPVGNSNLIYCGYAGSESGTLQMTKLTSYTSGANTWKDVYFADIPEGATTVKFYSGSADSTSPDSTGELSIPGDYTRPCFYADNSDDHIYKSGTAYRGGYWDEVFTIRNAGAGKNSDVVDIKQESFTKDADRLYLSTTFYDWYSDYELNGFNRDINKAGGGSLSGTGAHGLVPFRQLNQALSDVYSANSVSKPIYVGDFESGASYMSSILSTLDLYGRGNSDFFTNNNSGTDKAKAVQGLVDSDYSNGLKAAGSMLTLPLFDESFIGGSNSKNTVLGEVYHNVAFPFEKKDVNNNGVDYWVYNSNERSLAMQQDPSGQYYLKESGTEGWSDNLGGDEFGLFPFNAGATNQQSLTYNYGYGARIDLTFRLTEDGTVLDSSNNKQPIEFKFSGDDDVWVFIDGQLALDIGGAHSAVRGTIDFSGESATKNVTVSGVKVGSTNSTFSINGSNTDEHTLTMFYVERGLYDSNMYIQFNFPDENELKVEKNVDLSGVDGDFHSTFNNQSLYTFNIKNLATHYGAVAPAGANAEPVVVDIAGSMLTPASISTGEVTAAAAGNVFERTDSGEIHWRALYDDTDSSHRTERYGTITLPHAMDLGSMRSLEFKIKSSEAMSLSKMYLDLLDSSGKAKGCLSGYLSGKTLGTVLMTAGEWTTVKLDLSKLSEDTDFDLTHVRAIRFGYDEEQDIYLKDLCFQPTATIPSSIGFVTEQSAIADYDSSGGNELKNAAGAIYLSQKASGEASGNKAYVVGTDGNFVLENGETASFRDQFRRGSYIYLEEVLNDLEKQLYDTSWTMYEDDIPVTAFGTGNTVTNGSINSLSGIKGYVVSDGRTEKTDSTTISGGYNGTAPANSFVFRSYANPDKTATTTKLKAVYTNKVKTGSLSIRKENAGGITDTTKEFTFKVDFYNVGGLGLESQTITKTFTLKVGEQKTISGIPLNTEYSIYELKPEVGENEAEITLKEVLDNTANGSVINYTITTYGESDAYMVSGVVDDNSESDNVTFRNIQIPMVSLELTKLWMDGDDTITKENTPSSINLRLLRREKDSNDNWEPANDFYETYTFTPGYGDWVYTFEPLEKYVDYTAETPVEWEYKVVELDGNGNVIAAGGTVKLEDQDYTVGYGAVTDENSDGVFEQTITNRIGSKVSVTVTKEWKDFDNSFLTTELPYFVFPESVEISLQRRKNDTENWETVENTTLTQSADKEWTHTYEELDADYEYRVVEMHPDNGAVIAGGESLSMAGKTFKVTYSELTQVGTTSEYTQTITNTLIPTVMIDITKKSATEDKVLEGVVFKLEKQGEDNSWSAVGDTKTSDPNGFLRFAGLMPGKYRLTETKAASGYSLLKAPIEITISDAYEVTVPNIAGDTSRVAEDGNFQYALTIYNQKSLVMPATGGVHGFEFWILGGLCIMAVPLLLYTFLGYRKGGKKLRK